LLILGSIGLTVSVVSLFKNINLYFERRLNEEAYKIKTIFIVFTVCWTTRAIARIAQLYLSEFETEVLYGVMYFVWDILPLGIIMVYHYQSYSAQIKYL